MVKMAIRLKWGLPRWTFRANFSTVRLFVEYLDASWISYKLFHAFFYARWFVSLFFSSTQTRTRELIFYIFCEFMLSFFFWSGFGRWKFYHFFIRINNVCVYNTLCDGRLEKSVDWIDQKGASTFHPKSDIWCFACSFWQAFHEYLCTFVEYKKDKKRVENPPSG